MASTHLVTQNENFDIFARKLQKFSFKTFFRKTYFTQFREFVYNIQDCRFKGLDLISTVALDIANRFIS